MTLDMLNKLVKIINVLTGNPVQYHQDAIGHYHLDRETNGLVFRQITSKGGGADCVFAESMTKPQMWNNLQNFRKGIKIGMDLN